MELESEIEREVCNWADSVGVPSIKIKIRHWPDRLFFLPGKPIIVEFKRPDKTTRYGQDAILNMLRQLGYETYVHDNADQTIQVIKQRLRAQAMGAAGRPTKGGKVPLKQAIGRVVSRSKSGEDG